MLKFMHFHDAAFAASARRRVWIALAILIIALGVASVGFCYAVYYRFQHTVPDYSGVANVPGLGSRVRVFRDYYGVPHIFASSRTDALMTLGYIHASERMFQMELNRRAGQGRLSELFGPSMLDVDKFIRTLNLYSMAQSSVKAMSPEAQKLYRAYADGVNAWIKENKGLLPPEFLVVGAGLEPWQAADSLVWGKLLALQHSKNMRVELAKAKLASQMTPQQLNAVFSSVPGDSPVTDTPRVGKSVKQGENHDDPIRVIGEITGLLDAASNEWAISGKRTATGKPILANDPHLELSAPMLWYLVRIVTPDGELKGATVPGVPAVLLGQNKDIAWGFTTTGSDVQDLFVETVYPDNSGLYLTPDGRQPFETRMEVINVKGRGDVQITVRSTRHGPVISDVDKDAAEIAGKGKVVALAFPALNSADTTAEAMLRLNVARDWKDVLAAMKLYQGPPQNLAYADTKGNIGFFNPGLVPVRKRGNGTMPVDGASGSFDWRGFVPFTELPKAYNPPAGFVFNANNPVAGPDFYYWLGNGWEEGWRASRIQGFFDNTKKHSLETSSVMQADHFSPVVNAFKPRLLALKPQDGKVKQAIEMLRDWDGSMDQGRPEPLVFDAWLYFMQNRLFSKFGGIPEQGMLKANIVAGAISERKSNWCSGKPAPGELPCDHVMIEAFKDAVEWISDRQGSDMSKWKWGKEHEATFVHKIFTHVPFLSSFSDRRIPSSGDFYTLDRGGSFKAEEPDIFARRHGGGYRGIYDLADPSRSLFMVALGQSGHIMSPHYSDLLGMWNDVKYITLTGSQEEMAKNGLRELKLVP